MYQKKKPMTVSVNAIAVESLGDYFKSLGKKEHNASRKMAKKVLKTKGWA